MSNVLCGCAHIRLHMSAVAAFGNVIRPVGWLRNAMASGRRVIHPSTQGDGELSIETDVTTAPCAF
ncbi:MAG: hypothetical protein F4239_03545 [Gammaproteobacteria bacterium]|nr:hypothetical protein [Gammaproteobacteria bacterium]MYI88937.1 hypothetical protein [Gammaproteobacteria bacterium]